MSILNKIKEIYKNRFVKIKYYKSCDTIWKYNYDKVIETEDYTWLVKDRSEEKEYNLTFKQLNELKTQWLTIFEESIILKGDKSVVANLRQRALIENLKERAYWGATLLKLIMLNTISPHLMTIVEQLHKWKFKFDINKPLRDEIESVTKQLKSLKTKINIEVSKYEKNLENKSKKEKISSQEQIRAVEKVLELRYPLNSKEITQSQWIAYVKDAESVIKLQKKQNNKKNG